MQGLLSIQCRPQWRAWERKQREASPYSGWGTTRCDLIIHETIEFSYLLNGLRELGFELPYDKRGVLLGRMYHFAHTKGIEAENTLRAERKAKDFRSMSCDDGE